MNLQLKKNTCYCQCDNLYLKLLHKTHNIFLPVEVIFRWCVFLKVAKVMWC